MEHFLILGGGFAGVEAAIKLRKKGYKVTLVSNRDYLFIYPISIWIPVKEISFEDSTLPLTDLQKKHGFDLVIDSVVSIDPKNKKVILQNSEQTYDYLFIALGMERVQFEGAENTLSICGNPKQALTIGDELDKLISKGSGKISVGFGGNPKDTKGSTVRGGPAFELLFNFSTYIKRKGLADKFELNFFAPMAEPGKKMGEKAFANLGKFFKHYRIKEHVGVKIKGFTKNEILFADGKKLESDLTVYIAGGKGLSMFEESGLPLSDAGFIKTLPTCQVEGHPEIYAIGDSAELLGPKWAAKQGHLAEIMGNVAAHNAHQQITGSGETKSYVDKINIICIMDSGDGAAYVSRTTKKETMIMLPIVGHWLKKGWGFYFKNSKLKRIPHIPGM